MTKIFFVTGTDTNIGKTLCSCAILQSAILAGYSVAGFKPISTGCKKTYKGPRNPDALELIKNSTVKMNYSQINPISFIEPTAPYIASKNESKNIDFSILSHNLYKLKKNVDLLIVEGVGGLLTPLNKKLTFVDWIKFEKLPIILVIGIKLGCINHALLTELAINKLGLTLSGWIANHPLQNFNRSKEYLIYIKNKINSPMLGEIPWIKEPQYKNLSKYINISKL